MDRQTVELIFDAHIQDLFKEKSEVMRFLLAHERKDLCLNNLVDQIRTLERFYAPSKSQVHTVIKDIARMFAHTCLDNKKEQLMSSAERARLESKANYLRDAETTFLKDHEKEALTEVHRVFIPGRRDEAK